MAVNIKTIKKPFESDLKRYEETFREVLSSNVYLIDTIVKYVVKNRGKGLRPLLVIMAAKLAGNPNDDTYVAASVIELLHTASLVHDDVVDDAHLRRGLPSINAVWKNKIAVLMGDYMLSKCLIGAAMTDKIEIMKILAEASKKLSKGELIQIEKSRKMSIDEKDYLEIIANKTAGLIGAAAEIGTITTSNSKVDRQNLLSYGENLGMAFQIKDDLLDYYGDERIIGKPTGNDLREKKVTLPLIHAFQNADTKEIRKVKRLLKRGVSNKDIKYIIQFVEKHNGISYAKDKSTEYAQKAKNSISDYPQSDVKESLLHFVDYIIERKK